MAPTSPSPSARPSAKCAPGFLRSSTIGRCGPVSWRSSASLTRQSLRRASSVGYMAASGLVPRRLRRRSSASASALRASHARWKPPRPFTATMPPFFSRATAASTIASDDARSAPTRGVPSASAGAFACSASRWRARSASASSARSTVRHVRCGPHSKQASGCAWKRRSSGSAYSAAHCSHMANFSMDVYLRS